MRELYPGRVAWIVPPAIAVVKPGSKWEKWELCAEVDVEEGEECVFRRAKKWEQEEEEGRVWYDRELFREIYLYADYQEPAGVLDSFSFGQPAPRVKYVDGTMEKYPRRRPSYWMYRSRLPDRRRIGEMAPNPAVEDLPFAEDSSRAPLYVLPKAPLIPPEIKEEVSEGWMVPETGALEGEEPSLRTVSKGKGREGRQERAVSEDAVSLGDPLTDEEGENLRQVDDFLTASDLPHPPSRFLRLRHLPGDPSSFTFVERFARALQSYGKVEFMSVLNAQHAIWVCVADARGGEQTMAFFRNRHEEGDLSETEVTFVAEDAFTEAGLYCSDIWHPTLTQGSDSVTEVPMQVDEAPLPLPERQPPSAPRAMRIPETKGKAPAEYRHWEPYTTPFWSNRGRSGNPAYDPERRRERRSRSLSPKARRALSKDQETKEESF